MAKVLVVDSDPVFLARVREALEGRNHRVIVARTLRHAVERLRRHKPNIIVIDPFLRDSEGYDACRFLRVETEVPIVVATDNAEEIDKVIAFELGADDYLTKPVSMRELQARVSARLRTATPGPASTEPSQNLRTLTAGALSIDLGRRDVSKAGKSIKLRHKEFELLVLLMRRRGRTVARADLLKEIWGYEAIGNTRTVDVHIERLRKKIEDDATAPCYVITERGVGYRFDG